LRELLFRARPATKAIIIDVDDVYWRVADRLLPYALKQKAQVD
jgi:hypothetical protein